MQHNTTPKADITCEYTLSVTKFCGLHDLSHCTWQQKLSFPRI